MSNLGFFPDALFFVFAFHANFLEGELRSWVYSKYEKRCEQAYEWNSEEIV
jgi:hypothetical protein